MRRNPPPSKRCSGSAIPPVRWPCKRAQQRPRVNPNGCVRSILVSQISPGFEGGRCLDGQNATRLDLIGELEAAVTSLCEELKACFEKSSGEIGALKRRGERDGGSKTREVEEMCRTGADLVKESPMQGAQFGFNIKQTDA